MPSGQTGQVWSRLPCRLVLCLGQVTVPFSGRRPGEVGDKGWGLPREDAARAACLLFSDINECRRYPGRLCGHKCENTPGSYYCSCTIGFRLSSDGRSCEGGGQGVPRDLILPQAAASWGNSPLCPSADPFGTASHRAPAHMKGRVSRENASKNVPVRDDSSPRFSLGLGPADNTCCTHGGGRLGCRSCMDVAGRLGLGGIQPATDMPLGPGCPHLPQHPHRAHGWL